jgi:TetR/AcrR family transcriptional regulator
MNQERKARNGLGTKERVLEAASKIFSRKGFNGSSLTMIAEASGISVGLILHHFKSKEELHSAVLAEVAARYRNTIAGAMSLEKPEDAARALEAVFRFWSRDEVYARISLWSFLEGRPGLADAEAATSIALTRTVGALQAAGKADNRFDPQVLLAMTIGPIHFWNRYRDSFKEQLGLAGNAEAMNENFLRQFSLLIEKLYAPAGAAS